jgi:hypothetical protein
MICGITLRDFSSRFYLPRQTVCFQFAFLVAALTALGAAGCRRGTPAHAPARPGAGLSSEALELLPEQAEMVLFVDRLRGGPLWKVLSSAVAEHAGAALAEIAAGTGLEVMRQVRKIWIALPGERQPDGRFVLLAETQTLDRARVAAWMHKRARDGLSVAVPSPNQIWVGKGEWNHLPDGRAGNGASGSAVDGAELRRLCERTAGDHSAWLAALVPMSLRRSLMDAGRFSDVAALVRVFGFLDASAGLHVELVGEFANTTDPPEVAHRLQVLHNQARRNPDMLVAGLSPYLEALRVEARDAQVRLALDLPEAQTVDFVEHAFALARSVRTKYSPAP